MGIEKLEGLNTVADALCERWKILGFKQEVRKKAREVEEKTRQAEQIKHELDSELERLRSVKRVGEYDAVGSSA